MSDFDVVVVGAGLAGLQCARLLSGHALRVLLVDRKADLGDAIHTTGIFVRRSLEEFTLPPSCLGPPIRHVTLYSPSRRTLELESPYDEFRIGRMGPLYGRLLKDCQAAGAEFLPATQYLSSAPYDGGSLVRLRVAGEERTVQTRYLIAADGANLRVARDLGLDQNERWIVGLEDVITGVPAQGPPRLHCFLDHRVAPGYIAWVAMDGEGAHVGVGGNPGNFQPAAALARFRESISHLVPASSSAPTERRGGRIPVGGILARIANPLGLLIGDAAGAVSPLTAGGLDPCLRLSQLASQVTREFLATGNPACLAAYDGRPLRKRCRARQALRTTFALAGRNLLLEAGCVALRTRPGRRFAQRVFFGNGSFLDPAPKQGTVRQFARDLTARVRGRLKFGAPTR